MFLPKKKKKNAMNNKVEIYEFLVFKKKRMGGFLLVFGILKRRIILFMKKKVIIFELKGNIHGTLLYNKKEKKYI